MALYTREKAVTTHLSKTTCNKEDFYLPKISPETPEPAPT
jgi:hypothetical protein